MSFKIENNSSLHQQPFSVNSDRPTQKTLSHHLKPITLKVENNSTSWLKLKYLSTENFEKSEIEGKSQQDFDKLLSSCISNAYPKTLIEIYEEHKTALNPIHWVLFSKKVAEYKREKKCSLDQLNRFYAILKNIPNDFKDQFPPGPNAQLACSIGDLDIEAEELSFWFIKNGLRDLQEFSPKEIYLLTLGLRKITSPLQLKRFVCALSSYFLDENKKIRADRFLSLRPQAIATLLRVHGECSIHNALWKELLNKTQDTLSDFKVEELCEALPSFKTENRDVTYIYFEIETALLQKLDPKVCTDFSRSLAACILSFSKGKYLPKRLLDHFSSLLKNPGELIKKWDQITISFALSNFKDYSPSIARNLVINLLKSSSWKEVYLSDQILLLKCASEFLDLDQRDLVRDLALHVKSKYARCNHQDQEMIDRGLSGFGF